MNPFLSGQLDNGLEVSALHNHFFFGAPRIFYMHVHGHEKATDLATKVQPAIALIGKAGASSGAAEGRALAGTLDSAQLAMIVGHEREQNGQVYKITIGRDDLALKEMGAAIKFANGLNVGRLLRQ